MNADLENGYADEPELAAETVRRAAEAGAVGASIEDFTGDAQRGVYDFQQAVERVHAAAETAHSLTVPVMLACAVSYAISTQFGAKPLYGNPIEAVR